MVTESANVIGKRPKRGAPPTLWLGLGLIALSEVMLAIDVSGRGGMVVPLKPGQVLPSPVGDVQTVARWFAVNMTGICWMGYLLTLDGLLTWLARRHSDRQISCIRARPNRFLVVWLISIPVWCFFDWANFYFMDAWRYWGLPPRFGQRVVGYFVAFAAISPGMFMTAQLYQALGARKLLTTGVSANRRIAGGLTAAVTTILALIVLLLLTFGSPGPGAAGPRWGAVATAVWLLGPVVVVWLITRRHMPTALAVGAAFTTWAIAISDPLGSMALWIGMIFLLDPINSWLGAPSIIDDWRCGRWGRWLALMAGGATCGLLWEFWNYWALAKWTYNLPFLGPLEHVGYFEMPVVGFLGFLPFAIECWVVLNTVVALMERMKLRIAEPLSDHWMVM